MAQQPEDLMKSTRLAAVIGAAAIIVAGLAALS
jgi:hypothetical protein